MYNNTCVETRQTNKCLIGVWLSLARAPDLGSGGRRFESCHPDLISSLRQAQIKRVQFNGRTLAFQARYVGSIPITRSLFCKYISCMQDIMCPQLSWIEQRPSKPWVGGSNPFGHIFILYGGYGAVGQRARLWLWRPRVRVPLSTLFFQIAGFARVGF